MNFEEAHEAFIRHHIGSRTGERKGRLERGHREAEKLFCQNVWWPFRRSFDHLHPEYEVLDWRGRSFFCDFAFLTAFVKLIIEIKGFGPHVQEMDRRGYCRELNRETFLTGLGYQVISFAYDDVAYRPELCITLLRLVLSRFQAASAPIKLNDMAEREIVRLACTLARPIRPIDVERHLGVNHRTAVRTLQALGAKGVFVIGTSGTGKYSVRYELQAGDRLQGLL